EFVVAVTAVEMPLRTEVVVQASDSKIGGVVIRRIGFEALLVDPVAFGGASKSAATTTTGSRLIRKRHERVPHLLDQGVDSDVSRITCGSSERAAVVSGIHVVLHTAECKDASSHVGCWHNPLDGGGVRPPE